MKSNQAIQFELGTLFVIITASSLAALVLKYSYEYFEIVRFFGTYLSITWPLLLIGSLLFVMRWRRIRQRQAQIRMNREMILTGMRTAKREAICRPRLHERPVSKNNAEREPLP